MKLAFVCPRFGTAATVGGAETLARELARRLPRERYEVEIITTCAQDHFSWHNDLPPGLAREGELAVRRFPVDPRDAREHRSLEQLLAAGETLSPEEEKRWLASSSHSRELYRYLETRAGALDLVFFIPYLFGTTLRGAAIAPKKSVLIPCLHDEPYARLNLVREMFGRARGALFNSPEEQQLAGTLYGFPGERGAVVGLGLEPAAGDGRRFRRQHRLEGPLVLYAGRLEEGKGVRLLVTYFNLFAARTKRPVKLALMGKGPVPLPGGRGGPVISLGFLSERDKRDAYAAADVFCQPSRHESFSIVLLEAWQAGAAALVNAGCAVTRAHCERSGGGLWFSDYAEFEEALAWLLDHPESRAALGDGGRRYVEANYSWSKILERFEDAVGRFTAA